MAMQASTATELLQGTFLIALLVLITSVLGIAALMLKFLGEI